MSLAILHVAYREDDAAGRAGQRAHRAARAAGLRSSFAVLAGGGADAILLRRDAAPDLMGDAIGRAIARAAPAGLSFAHPALALDRHPLFLAADVLHLHGALPGLAPASVRHWLDAGKRVVWSLHDHWPLTGGCHRPGACEQWRSACMACPVFDDAWSLVPNAFDEKRAGFDDPRLVILAPTRWMEARAPPPRLCP